MFSVSYKVEQSIEIEKPLSDVQHAIADFEEWKCWSPWLHMEPGAVVTITGDGKSVGAVSAWEGTYIGSGEMERTHLGNTKIDQIVRFKKPFKSSSNTSFTFEMMPYSVTKVTWTMSGKLPFFLFFMKSFFQRMIGNDFKRGLLMLKEYLEKGYVSNSLHIEPELSEAPACTYVGIEGSGKLEDLGAQLKEQCQRLAKEAQQGTIIPTGPMMTINTKSNMMKNHFEYIVAFPVEHVQKPEGMVMGTTQAVKALKVVHEGSYAYLPGVWSAAMGYMKYHKMTPAKQYPSLEIYVTTPMDTDEQHVRTEIYIPIA